MLDRKPRLKHESVYDSLELLIISIITKQFDIIIEAAQDEVIKLAGILQPHCHLIAYMIISKDGKPNLLHDIKWHSVYNVRPAIGRIASRSVWQFENIPTESIRK